MNSKEYQVSYFDHMIKIRRSRTFQSLADAEQFIEMRQATQSILYSNFILTIHYGENSQ